MAQYLRLYQSAVDPGDLDEVRRRFAVDVRPVFAGTSGCLSIELAMNVGASAGGLVEGAAISRWSSLAAMEAAMAGTEIGAVLASVAGLLRREPVTRVLEVLD